MSYLQIYPTANFTGYETYGNGASALTLSQWGTSNYTYRGTSCNRYQTFTDHCVPVRDDKYTPGTGGFGFVYEEFSNVVLGIINPNVFIPPPNCKPQ